MAERAYLSIGEVLSLLREEFPDVTISKIRFLESQGLLDPERTPSGYRKFYEGDVDRLRWILRQQREHFLPLKVIKGRLLGHPDDGALGGEDAEGAPDPEPAAPGSPAPGPRDPGPFGPGTAAPRLEPDEEDPEPIVTVGPSGVSFTLEELASASGLTLERLRELERGGFIAGGQMAGATYYDEECLVVAKLTAGFARYGLDPRHLRTYKNAVEREAGLLEQVVTPLLKQRNPEARREAAEALEELSRLGQRLRVALLRQAIKGLTGG